MRPVEILNSKHFRLIIYRLCHQLIENHNNFSNSVIIGLQPRGVYLAQRLSKALGEILHGQEIQVGLLDITFHRDDFRKRDIPALPNVTDIDFTIEDKKVILIDDVLYTGRTIRAGLEAMLTYGRPKNVELLVLIDRRFSRDLPIQANYIGRKVDSIDSERVSVEWDEVEGEDKVLLYKSEQ